ncbi:hypothetical protein GXM_08987 [Nostoc sphaeroides CCNUC1]|uniref:Uncharacterized protein n=1 Tax=Nostoc sphaeroides CCNUC1 TaxID=2653204 RepID=A0A5P8WF90_9NOSO|nr:hypothetical protein GXM_08987 [Nostoc sphaeroides CCNUC1]
MRRDAKANKTRLQESDIPKLWVLSPTASPALLSSFNVNQKSDFSRYLLD